MRSEKKSSVGFMNSEITYILKNEDSSTSRYSIQSKDNVPFFNDIQKPKMKRLFGNIINKFPGKYCYSSPIAIKIPSTQGHDKIEMIIYKLEDMFHKSSFSLEFHLDSMNKKKFQVHNNLPGVYHSTKLHVVEGEMFLIVMIMINKTHLVYEKSSRNISMQYNITEKIIESDRKFESDRTPQTTNVACAFPSCDEVSSISCACDKVAYCSTQHKAEHLKESHLFECPVYSYNYE